MSYLVLARKSRPQCFAEVVGQKPVVRTLQNALRQGRVPHALIFSGVRGTGKTTLARIMAKALNCEQGPAEEPCLQCVSCREITEGISIDLQEVDGASNRGIQEIRELKEKICFMPVGARYKIILIDEVHMLTTEAFNALLKTLEEPPEHVYFMFATTEPHKVPLTILSRCQRYELKQLSHQDLSEHFQRLAEQEGVRIEPEALNMVVREARGSVRDGLSLLDQVFSYCGEEVRATDLVDILGLVSNQLIGVVANALLAGDLSTVFHHLDEMYLHAADIRRFSNDLLQWFRNLLACKLGNTEIAGLSGEEIKQLQTSAAPHSFEVLSTMFRLLLEGLDKVALSRYPRLAMEIAFIRAAQAREIAPLSDLISRFDQLLTGVDLEVLSSPAQNRAQPKDQFLEQSKGILPDSTPPQFEAVTGASFLLEQVEEKTETGQEKKANSIVPQPAERIVTETLPETPEMRNASIATMEPEPAQVPNAQAHKAKQASESDVAEKQQPVLDKQQTVDSAEEQKRIRKRWPEFLDYVKEYRRPWIAESLRKASSLELQDDELLIRFDDSIECSLLKRRHDLDALTEFLLDFYQRNLRVRFIAPGPEGCASDEDSGLVPQQERRALANESLVRTATEVFNGHVGDIRIGPAYRNHEKKKTTRDKEMLFPSLDAEA